MGVVFLRGKIQIILFDKVDQKWYTVSVLKETTTQTQTEVFSMKFKTLEYRVIFSDVVRTLRSDGIDHFEVVDPVDHDCYIKVYTKGGKIQKLDLNVDLSTHVAGGWCIEGIEVDEHYGTWYTIDIIFTDGKIYLLCEHEEYGDETANIIIDLDGNLILDEVWNGFDDLADHLDTELDI